MVGPFFTGMALLGPKPPVLPPIALVLAVAMNAVSYWNSDKIVLRMYGAQKVDETHPDRLIANFAADVHEMSDRAGMPRPKVYLIDSDQPNAFYTVLGKSLIMRYGSALVTAYVMLLGALYLTPALSPQFVRSLAALSWQGWASALFSGLLATSVSYLLWNRGLSVLQPAQVAVYIYLVPVFGVLAAAALLGDPRTPRTRLGGRTNLPSRRELATRNTAMLTPATRAAVLQLAAKLSPSAL